MKFIEKLKSGVMDLLFPPVCGSCSRRLQVGSQERLCPDCTGKIRFLEEPLCPVCGMEQLGQPGSCGHLCGSCLSLPPSYELARSLVRYETAVRQLIHKLKYGGDTSVSGALAALAARADLSLFSDCHYILPVPLHLERLRGRGLNQAAVLAGLLFPGRKRSIRPDGLMRVRNTVAQTDLRGIDRRKNLKNAFRLNDSFDAGGAIVCLVDDVFTTGTTVLECSRLLKSHGAREVRVITLARAGMTGRRNSDTFL